MKKPASLKNWVIYERPTDHPVGFVVREFEVTAGEVKPLEAQTAPTLEAARELVPAGLYRIDRFPQDDPNIVEVWM